MITDPAVYSDAAWSGLKLFALAVFPAIFPFFFLIRLLTSLGAAPALSKVFKKPVKFLFNANALGGYVFALSLLSGYPVGAKTLADLSEKGLLSDSDARAMTAFTSTTGPMFLIGTVGVSLLQSYKAGLIIFACHIIAALINGVIFRSPDKVQAAPLPPHAAEKDILGDAISSSVTAVLQVGGYMVLFNVAVCALQVTGALKALGAVMSFLGSAPGTAEGVITGIVEVTKGAATLASSGAEIKTLLPAVGFIVSFGGLSVIFQSMNFLNKCDIKGGYFIMTKFSHAVITFVLCSGAAWIFY